MIFCDIETYSELDVREVGAHRYAEHPSTLILIICWAVDDGPVQTWTWRDGPDILPPRFIGEHMAAHNAEFEREVMGAMGLIANCTWEDTAAMAAMCALPRGLGRVGTALGLEIQKDKRGSYLIGKLSKPQRPSKTNPNTLPELRWPKEYTLLLNEFAAYCATDVEVCREVYNMLPKLPPMEQQIFEHTLLMNTRGIAVDIVGVEAARAMVDSVTGNKGGRVVELTGFTYTQLGELLTWVNDRIDRPIESMDKATVSSTLRRQNLPADVREVLEIRRELAKSSTAKLDAILARVCSDGRVRGSLMYHGAGTGRWAGAGIQPQNFPRTPKGHDPDDCVDAILSGDPEWIEALWSMPVPAFVSATLRAFLIAPPGRTLAGADYSSIEARIVLWLAKDPGVELFASGADIYVEMAAAIAHDAGRPLGKQAVLGCFGGDTPVLTKRGWIPLLNITLDDRVWDGTEWVSHGGVVCQGEKEVLDLFGVKSTPDHQILTHESWVSAYQVAHGDTRYRQSALSLGNSGLRDMTSALGVASGPSGCPARVITHTFTQWTPLTLEKGHRPAAMPAPSAKRKPPRNTTGVTLTSYPTTSTGLAFLTGCRRALRAAITPAAKLFRIMGAGGFLSTNHGAPIDGPSSPTSSHSRGGTTPVWNLTEPMLTGVTNRGICGLSREAKTRQTSGRSETYNSASPILSGKMQTFDIAYSGPRNRYTILTDAGPLIVHNCGFGMGPPRFQSTCEGYGMDVDLALAERAVKAYRSRFPKVPALWRALEDAALTALRRPGTIVRSRKDSFVPISYIYDGERFLTCTLPSGRKLYYPFPALEDGKYGKQLTYMGVDPTTKAWRREHTYGGKLTENVVQAIARDLMALALLHLEDAGYPTVMTVHDEAVCEVEETATADKVVDIMCQLPEWAAGLPVAAEGFTGKRYS